MPETLTLEHDNVSKMRHFHSMGLGDVPIFSHRLDFHSVQVCFHIAVQVDISLQLIQ